MKSILMSIRPQWVAKILNREKTIEIRKKFPKGYVGWVYIYVTQDSKQGWCMVSFRKSKKHYYQPFSKTACYSPLHEYVGNGKVVARFWCDKVEEINFHASYNEDIRGYRLNNIYSTEKDLLEKSCLTQHELYNYLPHISPCGYAIHITKLEIFDKPKEISEFMLHNIKKQHVFSNFRLIRAPQSWCYIEV